MIFIANELLITLEAFILKCSKIKNARSIFLVLTFIQLFILLAFRAHSVGIDTQTYISYLHYTQAGMKLTYVETLNRIIMQITGKFENAEIWYLGFYAFFTLYGMYYFIRKCSQDIYMSVMIYAGLMFYFFSFNAMRQGLAISIVAAATAQLAEKKYKSFFCLLILAVLIHKSAIVAILLWVMVRFRISFNVKKVLLIVAVSVLVAVLNRKYIVTLLSLIRSYAGYLDTEFAQEGSILHPLMFLSILILLFFIWEREKRQKTDNLFFIMLAIGVLLYFMSMKVQILNRLVYYFTFSVIVLIPNVTSRISGFYKRLPYVLGTYLVVFLYSCLVIERGSQGIIPYYFIWE